MVPYVGSDSLASCNTAALKARQVPDEKLAGGSALAFSYIGKVTVVALTALASSALFVSGALPGVVAGGIVIGAALLLLACCASCCDGRSHYPSSKKDHYYHYLPFPTPSPRIPYPSPAPSSGGPRYPVGVRHGDRAPPSPPPTRIPPSGDRFPVGDRHPPARPLPPAHRGPSGVQPPKSGDRYTVGERH